MDIPDISTAELKTAFAELYKTECNDIWRSVNLELSRRLSKNDYAEFINHHKNNLTAGQGVKIGKLKKYLDTLGIYAYICVYNGFNRFYCEGTVKNLRDNSLWSLLDEENTDVACSYFGQSESGEEAIIIILHIYPHMKVSD